MFRERMVGVDFAITLIDGFWSPFVSANNPSSDPETLK